MLKVENLKKTYPKSDRVAVDNISFELKPGEIFGFLGQNGAGKSTTIKCLTGILPFDSGTITICGHDIVKEPIKAKMEMGYVPDNHSVYEKLTGREYVNYVADLYKVPALVRTERIDRYAKLFKLEAAIDRQIKSYSHGMKQKLCLIASLIHNPKIWILDEPTVGLDAMAYESLISVIQDFVKNGRTVLITSHNLDMVGKLCNRVAIINEGVVARLVDLDRDSYFRTKLNKVFFAVYGGE